MNSSRPPKPTVAQCRAVLARGGWAGSEIALVEAAATLMENCEFDRSVTLDDALACLDYPGTVAEFGARILYVRTGRDGLGWHRSGYLGLPFRVEKAEWLDYLKIHVTNE